MKTFLDWMQKKLVPLASMLGKNKYLTSLRDGMMIAFPATMFGAIMVILQNLPQTFGFAKFLSPGVLKFFNDFFAPVGNATMNISAMFIAFGVAYQLAGHYKQSKVFAGAISLSCFLMMTLVGTDKTQGAFFPITQLGAQGMFVAIITALVSSEIYCHISMANITIKLPDSVPPMIGQSFVAIIPGAVPLLLANIIRYVFTFTPYKDAIDFIYKVLQQPLMGLGDTLPAVLIAVFFTQLFWWFGIHGTLLVNSIIQPIMDSLALQNYNAYRSGVASSHLPHIINTTFMGVFVCQGLQLGVALVFAFWLGRSARMKTTMKTVLVPSIFNVSEPMTYGLPVVLNPVIFIPWILAPMASTAISYCAIAMGLVPRPIGATVVWSTPIFISGWLGTGSIAGAILQIVDVIVMTLIFIPFMKALDKSYLVEENKAATSK
ncbi:MULTISPECIES: PTS sugar transporter subunit IIC [Lactobacillus]|jgi:PTS system cellobiose-specific IIC component|uniref:Permease IIC component n=3 Tax=Bacteria TaxID=2 RepID=A0AAW6XIF2_9LACO|nr:MULTISPECIES: PTS transporter subunit EIIC [Lactobacillus]MBW8451742.1 PTS transporter subunit EIIC [Lactobacillus paragasseri]MCQ5245886.1 PTS transporter subunit EIIC [Lactobacillus gasseri]MCZ3507954.1 PTS transporter subunit EIIC [Lactobacillus gasseri]MDK6868000.1 PTS transporter subunit EIIC [Lactobacillus paragasseri]MDK7952933.1 PTS transporter subunit EIIC [Lactobacillus paragasseri]